MAGFVASTARAAEWLKKGKQDINASLNKVSGTPDKQRKGKKLSHTSPDEWKKYTSE